MSDVATWSVVIMLFGHWVSDFVAQPHWISLRKSKEWLVLANHAGRITLGGFVTALVIIAFFDGGDVNDAAWWALINGVGHFAIDAVTSRMTSRLWKEEKVHEFFVVIGFDQFLHMALAVTTLAWLVV